jgi:hypothetical protein
MRKDVAYVLITCDRCEKTKIKVPMVPCEGAGYLYPYIPKEIEPKDWEVEVIEQGVYKDICPKCAEGWRAEIVAKAHKRVDKFLESRDEGF